MVKNVFCFCKSKDNVPKEKIGNLKKIEPFFSHSPNLPRGKNQLNQKTLLNLVLHANAEEFVNKSKIPRSPVIKPLQSRTRILTGLISLQENCFGRVRLGLNTLLWNSYFRRRLNFINSESLQKTSLYFPSCMPLSWEKQNNGRSLFSTFCPICSNFGE